MIALPTASDPTESLADWVELQALKSRDRSFSSANLVKFIRQTGSTDAITSVHGDSGSELSQSIAQDAFAEIDNRLKACGVGAYPFEVQKGLLQARPNPEAFPYSLCAHATLGYLGGPGNNVESVRFGAPRKVPLAKLSQAIDNLCGAIGEGDGCRKPQLARHTGDNGLDIVAWRNFPDNKQGKLIAFGQCAAGGSGWENKLAEMDASAFVKKWLRTPLVVNPIRMFFVPRRISSIDWENAGIDGGVLFDRCRIAACLQPDLQLDKKCKKATKAMLRDLRRHA
jgi:hypothetical protein